GELLVGSLGNAILSGQTGLTVSGNAVAVGSSSSFAFLLSSSDLTILATTTFVMVNGESLLQAAGTVRIGETSYGVGTPVSIGFGGRLQARAVTIMALADITLNTVAWNVQQTVSVAARGSLTIAGGTIVSEGTSIALLADVDGNGAGDVTVNGGATITSPKNSPARIEGWGVFISSDARISPVPVTVVRSTL
ncbi:MAG TPA: hypothetical protein VIO38_17525, partial [Rariglobus sp.]